MTTTTKAAPVVATLKQGFARQAIVTRYFGPTNTRGSRIKATAAAGSVYVSYDHALNTDENHAAAAAKLAAKFGWDDRANYGQHIAGGMPEGSGNVFVEMPKAVTDLHNALGELVQFCAGNRGNRDGNPYSKPEVQNALKALFHAANGYTTDDFSEYSNAAEAWNRSTK